MHQQLMEEIIYRVFNNKNNCLLQPQFCPILNFILRLIIFRNVFDICVCNRLLWHAKYLHLVENTPQALGVWSTQPQFLFIQIRGQTFQNCCLYTSLQTSIINNGSTYCQNKLLDLFWGSREICLKYL